MPPATRMSMLRDPLCGAERHFSTRAPFRSKSRTGDPGCQGERGPTRPPGTRQRHRRGRGEPATDAKRPPKPIRVLAQHGSNRALTRPPGPLQGVRASKRLLGRPPPRRSPTCGPRRTPAGQGAAGHRAGHVPTAARTFRNSNRRACDAAYAELRRGTRRSARNDIDLSMREQTFFSERVGERCPILFVWPALGGVCTC